MLYDTSWLAPGKIFPPPGEALRLADYTANELLFDGDSYRVYKRWYKASDRRMERVLGAAKGTISYNVEINYHRLTSVGTADLICGELPMFRAAQGSASDAINRALSTTKLLQMLHSIFIDVSRYGDAAVRLYRDKVTGKAALVQYNPGQVYKIVDPECPTSVTQYVLATVVEAPDSTPRDCKHRLVVQIHSPGSYVRRVYDVVGCEPDDVTDLRTGRHIDGVRYWRILRQAEADEIVQTGLSGYAVYTLSQLVTSGTVWGHDDYAPLDPILAEVWARFGHVASILDKHAEPDSYAPESAFSEGADGVWHLKTGGNTYMLDPGDVVPGYITWDGQLSAAFAEIDKLLEQLYKVSEMGAIYEACLTGAAISTETAKMHFVKPLGKARRVLNGVSDTLLSILCAAAELNGDHLEPSDITATWCDGLPNDEMQEINKATAKINADLSTPERENIERFGVDQETADQIAEDVRDYNAGKAAQMYPGSGYAADPEEDEDDDGGGGVDGG